METSNKKDIRPVSRFQKIRLLSFYPLLAIAATWYIVKIGTFKIDWPLVPLVLFIIAVVSQTVGIAYYYKYAGEREIERSTGIRKTGNYFLSAASMAAFIGFYFMFDMLRLY